MSEAPSLPSNHALNFDLETVREVAQLLRETELAEITIETIDEDAPPARLSLRRATSPPAAQTASLYVPPTPVAIAESEGVIENAEESSTPAVPTTNVTSPAVGIFRPAPAPVQEGDAVKAGQPLGCVESLRVPNEVVAPVAGTVRELHANDGQGIEYGQVLLVIEETR